MKNRTKSGARAADSALRGAQKRFLQKFVKKILEPKQRDLAEQLRQQAIEQIKALDSQCVDKQKLIASLEVLKGRREGEYLLISKGDYGANVEFGTKNSAQLPWLLPSFVTVQGLIHTCQQGTPQRVNLKARQLRIR